MTNHKRRLEDFIARILVIDDEPTVQEILYDYLSAAGFEVTVAEDGIEGLALYRKEPFDLVLTDIMMPGKTGLEVIKELRADYPEARIIATAAGVEEVLSQAMEAGADHSLEKPFALKEVVAIMKEMLGEGT